MRILEKKLRLKLNKTLRNIGEKKLIEIIKQTIVHILKVCHVAEFRLSLHSHLVSTLHYLFQF